MKKILSISVSLLIALVYGASPVVRAIADGDVDAINKGSVYYKQETPCGFSGPNSGADMSNNAQAVWDFFNGKGLSPVAIAGIMGNFQQESGFDPAIKQNHSTNAIPDGGDGVTGFGIAQWTSQNRQAELFAKIREAGLGKYYGAGYGQPDTNKDTIPREDIAKLLDIELNYAWEGDATKIQDIADQLNAATQVGGDDGSTVLFHKLYERSADNAAQIAERVNSATDYISIFGDGGSEACKSGELGGVSNTEDAMAWAMKFVEDTRSKYNPGGHTLNNKENPDGSISVWYTNDNPVSGGSCWGGTYCGQCTALSGWFVSNMTDYTYGNGNGRDVVRNLGNKGVETGTEPRPFSVFSTGSIGGSAGHTGVVLGVISDTEVIALENNNGAHVLKIFQYDIKKRYPDVTFAYVGDKLKIPELAGADRLGDTLENFEQ